MSEKSIPELILQNIPIGIIYCDTDCIIRFINNTYAEYLGVNSSEATGRPITDLIPDSRLKLVMESGQAEMGDKCELATRVGNRTLVVNRLPVKAPDGAVIGAISQSLFGDPNELKEVAQRIVQLEKKVTLCKLKIGSALSAKYSLANIHGQSVAIVRAKELVKHYAKSNSPVLITGPTGTGKELFSHALHQESPRCPYPFVSINCAAIPPDLLESELFGYAPGAFTGARKEGKIGFVELADKGTLFLDEIGDMPLSAQVKVLRVLEDKVVYRVGSTEPHGVDFRLVVATNRELKGMFRKGTFREDLYYRFNAMSINIPPLFERIEDIPILVRHILDRIGKGYVTFSRTAMDALLTYHWPGNVRELKNVVERALSMCKDGVIDIGDLPSQFISLPRETFVQGADSNSRPTRSLSQFRDENEKLFLMAVLEENRWNIVRCAKSLSISRATLYEKLNKYALSREVCSR
jgi:transcriptional regulator with PAS, ATPase and Fis domain